jgi:hypothetical protein
MTEPALHPAAPAIDLLDEAHSLLHSIECLQAVLRMQQRQFDWLDQCINAQAPGSIAARRLAAVITPARSL